jgi:hypothetical protein
MIRLVIVASLLVGCRISLESTDTPDSGAGRQCTISTSQPCMEAVTHSDLAWIESKIFVASCNFSGCHSSANDSGKLDLTTGKSHADLVNTPSILDPSRKLVVPNDLNASYLMLMLHDITPEMATPPGATAPPNGYMPKGSATLCCQKLDAVERWIMAGAPM